jgi:hypothetical protein
MMPAKDALARSAEALKVVEEAQRVKRLDTTAKIQAEADKRYPTWNVHKMIEQCVQRGINQGATFASIHADLPSHRGTPSEADYYESEVIKMMEETLRKDLEKLGYRLEVKSECDDGCWERYLVVSWGESSKCRWGLFLRPQRTSAKKDVSSDMPFTTDVIGLLDSLKTLIETNVIGQQSTTVTAGSDSLTVETTCAYADGDTALIYDADATDETQAYEVTVMPTTTTTMWISPTPTTNIPSATIVRRIGGQYLRNIYVGNPPVTPDYPCIVIDGEVVDEVPIALAGTASVTYAVTVSTYVDAPDYDTANRTAWAYARQIEQCLTWQINPTTCQAIWRSRITDITQDQQTNDNSTLKCVHIHYQAEEMIQRLAKEMPILRRIGLVTTL